VYRRVQYANCMSVFFLISLAHCVTKTRFLQCFQSQSIFSLRIALRDIIRHHPYWKMLHKNISVFNIYFTRRKTKDVKQSLKKFPDFFLNNQTDAPIIQIYSVIKLYSFRASSLPIIRKISQF